MGVRVNDTTAEKMIVTPSVMANSRNNRPTTSPMNKRGIEHGNKGHCQGKNREPNLFGTLERGFEGRIALLDVPSDILDHDNGIVHDKTRGNGQRHERQVVEAESQKIHDPEGPDNGKRNGDGRDGRRGQIAQEEKNDQDNEGHSQQQFKLHVTDRGADGGRTVGQDANLHGGRQGTLQLGQEPLDAIHDFDHIGAGLPLNIQKDRGRFIHPRRLFEIFHIVVGIGDIRQHDRSPVSIGDDQFPVFAARKELIVGPDIERLPGTVKAAFRLIDVGCRQCGAEVFQGEAVGGQCRRVDMNPDGGPLPRR